MSYPVAERVPVAPLREAFLASGLTASEVCYRIGWLRGNRRGDTARLQSVLGLRQFTKNTKGCRATAKRINYPNAVLIARALDLDPVDIGL
jgi:hypothetical protein